MRKEKIIAACDKAMWFAIYAIAFYIPISTAFLEIFIFVAILARVIKQIINPGEGKKIFSYNFLFIPVLFYIISCFASSFLSVQKTISFLHLFFKTLKYSLLFLIVSESINKRVLRNTLIVLMCSVSLVIIDGISQYFTHFDFLRFRNQVIGGRINGPFKMPNDFSNYIVTILPLAASATFIKSNKKWIRISLLTISLFILIALILSATRSAWFAFIMTLPFMLLLGNRKLAVFALLAIVIVLSMFPFLPEKAKYRVEHFSYLHEAGKYSHRILVWDMALRMFLERPFFGQGLGTFMHNFERFKPHYYPYNWETSYAHNCLLQIAAETGLFGFFYFVSIIIILLWVSFITIRRIKKDHFAYFILSGLVLSVVAYLFSSLFDTNLYSVQLAVLFWFFLGLTTGTVRIIKEYG